MSYATIEAALATILKTISGFSASNVAQGNYRILGTGQTKAIVLMPGALTHRGESFGGFWRTSWGINLELYHLWDGEQSTMMTTIKSVRQDVIDRIDMYPTLDNTAGVIVGAVDSGQEPEIWAVGNLQYWRQVIRLLVEESVENIDMDNSASVTHSNDTERTTASSAVGGVKKKETKWLISLGEWSGTVSLTYDVRTLPADILAEGHSWLKKNGAELLDGGLTNGTAGWVTKSYTFTTRPVKDDLIQVFIGEYVNASGSPNDGIYVRNLRITFTGNPTASYGLSQDP